MSDYKVVSLPVPFRGLNQDENPTALGDADLTEAENIWFRGNSCGTRPGIEDEQTGEEYESALTGTPGAIQGGHEFRYAIDASRKHVVIAGGAVYSSSGTTVTQGAGVTITSGANNVWTFAEHKDKLYFAGGANADTICSWDGSGNITKVTFQSDTNADGVADTDIDAKYVFQWNGYGFLSGMNGTKADDNGMVVRYSGLNDMDSWPIGNTIGGSSAIGGFDAYGDNFTTGFGSYTDSKGDWLMVLTRKRIYAVIQTPDPLTPFYIASTIQNGCVHQDAYVSLGTDSGEAIYLSEHGIHSLRQSQQYGERADRFLSWPIRKLFASINRSRLKYSCGAYWADEGIVAFLVTLGTGSTHNAILALDVKGGQELNAGTARWTIWRPNSEVILNRIWTARSGSAYSTAPNREFLYAGTTASRVCRFNPAATSQSDRGAAFTTRFVTKHFDFGLPGVDKSIGDVWLNIQRGPGTTFSPTLKPVFDYGSRSGASLPFTLTSNGAKLDTFVLDVDYLGSDDSVQVKHLFGIGRGRSVAWSLETASANQAFWLTQLSYEVGGLGEDQGGGN